MKREHEEIEDEEGEEIGGNWPLDREPLSVVAPNENPRVIGAWATEWGAPRAVHRAAGLLAEEPDIFLDRSKNLIWVDDRPGLGANMKLLKPDDLDYLLHRANVTFVRFVRKDGKTTDVQSSPPKALRYAICAWRPKDAGWKYLRGFAACPYMLRDGNIVNEAGLNDSTGLWLAHDQVLALPATGPYAVHEHGLTQDRAVKAAAWLLKEMREFPWAKPTLDQGVWLAYLFTLATRPAYRICPFWVFDAAETGSGKDLVATCAEMIAMGRQAHRTGLDGKAEEDQKNIATALEAGDSVIMLGDVPDIGVRMLVRLVTELDNVRVRRLGGNTTIPIPPSLILACTANNVKSSLPDMIRRSVRLRLEPNVADPRKRKTALSQTQLLDVFTSRRPLYMATVFNILRGFLRAQKAGPLTAPDGKALDPLSASAFPEWASMVRDCVMWLGFDDIIKSQADLQAGVTTEKDKRAELIGAIWRWKGTESWRASEITALIPLTSLPPAERDVKAALFESFDDPAKLTPTRLSRTLTPLHAKVLTIQGVTGPMDAQFRALAGIYSISRVRGDATIPEQKAKSDAPKDSYDLEINEKW